MKRAVETQNKFVHIKDYLPMTTAQQSLIVNVKIPINLSTAYKTITKYTTANSN